jgi:hypothetical protein
MHQKAGTSSDHGPDLSHPTNESDQLLCVRLGDQEFALSIRATREIGGWISSPPPARAVLRQGHDQSARQRGRAPGVPRMLEQKSLIQAVNLYQSHRDDLYDQFQMMGRFRIT